MTNKKKFADLMVLLVLAALVALYGIDAARASMHVLNLIMVLPLTLIVLILCAVQFFLTIKQPVEETPRREPVRDVLPVMLLFASYVASLEWLGFDVGTFAFLCAFLWVHGERRLPWLLGYSITFSGLVVLFFARLLPYPMPLLLFSTAY